MPSLYASLLVLAAVFAAPNIDRMDCDTSAARYKTAVEQVIASLRAYAVCVARSDRHDDCADQIEALDNAHDDFADAIADARACE